MEDYPRNVIELEKQFATDEACKDYLFRLRWPNGFVFAYAAKPKVTGKHPVVV